MNSLLLNVKIGHLIGISLHGIQRQIAHASAAFAQSCFWSLLVQYVSLIAQHCLKSISRKSAVSKVAAETMVLMDQVADLLYLT